MILVSVTFEDLDLYEFLGGYCLFMSKIKFLLM